MKNDALDSKRYDEWQNQQAQLWEQKCTRCGACCGSIEGDPCEHLRQLPAGEYYCVIYENRFGMHKTVSGRPFRCVPIRDILYETWPGDECCGYKLA